MPENRIVLLWLPVGAGGHVAKHTSHWWEVASAMLERRAPQRLFHAALEVHLRGERYVIEMAPAWGVPRNIDRGVVLTGPVGLRALGRSRFFRYEVRCWRGGSIPDRAYAVGDPVVFTPNARAIEALLSDLPHLPRLVWGSTISAANDMWNSNSLVAWLLQRHGVDATQVSPPPGGRAPGWHAGLAMAGEPSH